MSPFTKVIDRKYADINIVAEKIRVPARFLHPFRDSNFIGVLHRMERTCGMYVTFRIYRSINLIDRTNFRLCSTRSRRP